LEGVKEAAASGNGQDHAAEFADDAMPVVEADTLFVAQSVEDLEEAVDAVWWERDHFVHRIDQPPQHVFGGGPAGVAFQHFLDGRGFVVLGMKIRIKGSEDLINGIKEGSAYEGALALVALT
jgi:hypothetical protein